LHVIFKSIIIYRISIELSTLLTNETISAVVPRYIDFIISF